MSASAASHCVLRVPKILPASTPTMTETPPNAKHPHPLLEAADWLAAPQTRRVFDVLEAAGFEARAVGGTVRNTLLGEPVNDIDLAIDAAPEDVMAAARRAGLKVVPTGITHGTVTIVVAGTPFEVTTLREDVSTDGRRATVAYTSDWKADAERRDFTINAIYCDRRGVLFDPVGGLADIDVRRVRFIGDPHARIREDYLRILRFFRFSAQYAGGTLDPAGLAACIEERAGLARLSAERIHHELMRLLAAPSVRTTIEQMATHGFVADLIGTPGDVPAFTRLIDHEEQHFGGTDPLLRFAALAVNQHEDALRLKDRLRLSRAEAGRLAAAIDVAAALREAPLDTDLRTLVYRHGNRATADGLALAWARADCGIASGRGTAGPQTLAQATTAEKATLAKVAMTWSPPTLPVTGRDIIAHGIAPGPHVSAILHAFEDWWLLAGFPEDPDLIDARLRDLITVTKP